MYRYTMNDMTYEDIIFSEDDFYMIVSSFFYSKIIGQTISFLIFWRSR